MCRHLAYLGPPLPLMWPLRDAPHALERQAWAPRDMRGGGTVNVDGFGVGWYPRPGDEPRRYRQDRPIWTDAGLAGWAGDTSARAVLAAVRSASPGMAHGEAACAPFAADGMLFSLNGRVAGWPESVAGPAGRLPVTDLLGLEAAVDAALVWALVRRRVAGGAPMAGAVADTVAEVGGAAPGSRLNLLLTDSHRIVATAVTHSLWVRHEPGTALVASEPLDDAGSWRAVPDGCLVVATRDAVEVSALPGPVPVQEGAHP